MRTTIILALLYCLIATGCKNNPYVAASGSEIEIYLLKSYTKVNGTDAINTGSVVLEDSPLINYADILWYDSSRFTFKITNAPAKWLNDFQTNHSHGRAFAVTIDKKILYTGYFWASFSSASCNWITIDPLNYSGKNELRVSIGYPGLMPGVTIPDLRNDTKLLDILEADKKLK
jgi:hypothetical protein